MTLSQAPELMPFQNKSFEPSYMKCEMAKRALPIFGGTNPESSSESSSSETSSSSTDSSKTTTNDSSGGGDSSTEKQITPEEFAKLTAQIAEITAKNTELTNELSTYTAKEEETRKASLGREEALSEDLTKAQQTIAQMDQVIKSLALVNAIQGSEYQFFNPRDVIARLSSDSYELNVDLENGVAEIKGIENELKRIATADDYLVKKPTVEDSAPVKRTPRGTGAPPGPAPTNPSKANRRKELEAKWPVIAAGRASIG